MHDKYTGLTQEHFDRITARYVAFQDTLNDETKDAVRVFDPLSKKSMEEIYLIREVSKDLQRKKEEDIKKAAQVAEEEEKAPAESDAKPEGEETKPETVK